MIRKIKQKLLLFATIGFIIVLNTACEEDLVPPKWELPQPIDPLLVGSWISDWELAKGHTIVTFYENNECIIKHQNGGGYITEEFRNWYVEGDTLILPGSYDSRMMRFPAYKYNLQDEELLNIDLIIYPFVGCDEFTAEGYFGPLGNMTPITYKKLEVE